MISNTSRFSCSPRTVLITASVCLITIFASVILVAAHKDESVTATAQSFEVTNNNSDGAGSLREAITNANGTPGVDTITFNIPGAGVKVISLSTSLPDITDQIVIDGA